MPEATGRDLKSFKTNTKWSKKAYQRRFKALKAHKLMILAAEVALNAVPNLLRLGPRKRLKGGSKQGADSSTALGVRLAF